MFEKVFSKDSIVLAMVTALAYVCAYAYEYGYVLYFGVPARLVLVSTQSLLLAWSAILVFIFTFGPIANSVFDFAANQRFRTVVLGLSYVFPVFYAVVAVYILNLSAWWKISVTCYAFIWICSFVLNVFAEKKKRHGYSQALETTVEGIHLANTLPQRLRKFFGPGLYEITMTCVFVMPALAFFLGFWNATSMRSFFTI